MLYGRSLIAPGAVVLYAYARGSGEYLFVPEEHAEAQSNIHRAFFQANTWGEYWSILPEAETARIRRWLEEMAEQSEPEEAARYRPQDDDNFDQMALPGVEDGDYPDQLSWLILDWLPRELIEDLDGVTGGPGSGLSLRVAGGGGPLPEVEGTFAKHGLRLVWDEERVLKASGWWWSDMDMGLQPV